MARSACFSHFVADGWSRFYKADQLIRFPTLRRTVRKEFVARGRVLTGLRRWWFMVTFKQRLEQEMWRRLEKLGKLPDERSLF